MALALCHSYKIRVSRRTPPRSQYETQYGTGPLPATVTTVGIPIGSILSLMHYGQGIIRVLKPYGLPGLIWLMRNEFLFISKIYAEIGHNCNCIPRQNIATLFCTYNNSTTIMSCANCYIDLLESE